MGRCEAGKKANWWVQCWDVSSSDRLSRCILRDDRHCCRIESNVFFLDASHESRNYAHTIVSATGKPNAQTCIPPRVSCTRQSRYLDNYWALTKFCISQFKAPRTERSKTEAHRFKTQIIAAKGYDDVTELVGEWAGEKDFADIVSTIEARQSRPLTIDDLSTDPDAAELDTSAMNSVRGSDVDATLEGERLLSTPHERPNPEPPTSCAPLGPSTLLRMPLPAVITGSDAITPSPTPRVVSPLGWSHRS